MRVTNAGVVVFLALGAGLATAPNANADHYRNGNGSGNHNAFSIHSPTTNHGLQIVSNANAGGISSSRNAFCKKLRFCHIHQAS